VLLAAGRSGEPRMQAAALRTMCLLCRAGGCGLPWQLLAGGGAAAGQAATDLQAQLLSGGGSIAAAVFAVLGGGAGRGTARDSLAVQLYGLASVGALLDAAAARSPAAAALLAAQLAQEHLQTAQEAVAAACGALGRSPELLAELDGRAAAAGADASAVPLDPSP
jgi:hypothetical protein